MSAERELPKHGVHLPHIGGTACLVHLRVGAVGTLKSTLKLALTQLKVLVVLFAGAHGTPAEVVEQDTVVNFMKAGEVEADVVAPERIDTKHLVGGKHMWHDGVLVTLH